MKDAPGTVSLREWEYLGYERFGEEQVRRLEEANVRLGGKVFDFYLHGLRARNLVGVVSAGGSSVQILPKTHGRSSDPDSLAYLLALLGYTGDLGLKVGDSADLGEHRGSFLEVWISHFARELNHLLVRSYRQQYVEVERRSAFVRGKLLTERDLDGSSNLYARYPCRYEVFTPDHLLNRTLKFCNKLLMKLSRSPKNRATLRENDVLLSDVRDVDVLAGDLRRIHLNRLDREYEQVLSLCRLLLESSTLDLRSGSITQLSFIFDMNLLFEKFVAEFLERNGPRLSVGGHRVREVEAQKHLGRLFGEFGMKVDVVVHTSGGTYLLDTKYKSLEGDKNHAGLSQADFYQMYGYVRSRETLYDGVILLYPGTSFSPVNRDFENRDGARLFVRTLDVERCHDGRGNVSEWELIQELNQAFEGIKARERSPA
ncbi:McrBC 5-methylcytosine restriction system component [Rubrobacter radiotolerans]|uniref:McrBC 5-methylcytosine restriction system component n=1 Tax=Rubrobacter radiotolerans TaxID=42256 RepID=A0A023X6H1_RUBRA|nr:hypothetical protein [Rubrobacter radiotolerans]AHY47826.1 McrBC 5-methylcytosine restriction system component [Rubrobacter radiotolerans]MDX5892465.1 hypothetical protein [Rubrobacter radiotolerans]SMC07756.1 5-methylcytosine-specific restriction enzyme subunit McrC [Rubrobacter radiotolerans DSM 5868]